MISGDLRDVGRSVTRLGEVSPIVRLITFKNTEEALLIGLLFPAVKVMH
jgi:hypothetical protein